MLLNLQQTRHVGAKKHAIVSVPLVRAHIVSGHFTQNMMHQYDLFLKLSLYLNSEKPLLRNCLNLRRPLLRTRQYQYYIYA